MNKKVSLSWRKFFHTSISRSLKNSGMKKTTHCSLRSSIFFSTKFTPNFFTCFISRFKNHSNKIDSKKRLLQYCSSSRKNLKKTNTPLRVVKNPFEYMIPPPTSRFGKTRVPHTIVFESFFNNIISGLQM